MPDVTFELSSDNGLYIYYKNDLVGYICLYPSGNLILSSALTNYNFIENKINCLINHISNLNPNIILEIINNNNLNFTVNNNKFNIEFDNRAIMINKI